MGFLIEGTLTIFKFMAYHFSLADVTDDRTDTKPTIGRLCWTEVDDSQRVLR